MPTSGSILLNKITLSSQKVVYLHHFKVMPKASQKMGVKNLLASPLQVVPITAPPPPATTRFFYSYPGIIQ